MPLQAALLFYEPHGVTPLAHGPLADDLPGYDERGPYLLHVLLGEPEHVDAAVHARVYSLAVSMRRVSYYLHIVRALEHDLYGYAELLGHPPGLAFAPSALRLAGLAARVAGAEGRGEVEGVDLYALIEHDLYGER